MNNEIYEHDTINYSIINFYNHDYSFSAILDKIISKKNFVIFKSFKLIDVKLDYYIIDTNIGSISDYKLKNPWQVFPMLNLKFEGNTSWNRKPIIESYDEVEVESFRTINMTYSAIFDKNAGEFLYYVEKSNDIRAGFKAATILFELLEKIVQEINNFRNQKDIIMVDEIHDMVYNFTDHFKNHPKDVEKIDAFSYRPEIIFTDKRVKDGTRNVIYNTPFSIVLNSLDFLKTRNKTIQLSDIFLEFNDFSSKYLNFDMYDFYLDISKHYMDANDVKSRLNQFDNLVESMSNISRFALNKGYISVNTNSLNIPMSNQTYQSGNNKRNQTPPKKSNSSYKYGKWLYVLNLKLTDNLELIHENFPIKFETDMCNGMVYVINTTPFSNAEYSDNNSFSYFEPFKYVPLFKCKDLEKLEYDIQESILNNYLNLNTYY